jgi:hypothetical protein
MGFMTATSGASGSQVSEVRGPNLSDSQADSAGSIPVTRSINPQVSGHDAASVRLARLLLISTGHYGPLTAIWHRVPLVSHDSKPASLIDLELMGDLGQRAGQVRPGRTVVGDIALRGRRFAQTLDSATVSDIGGGWPRLQGRSTWRRRHQHRAQTCHYQRQARQLRR